MRMIHIDSYDYDTMQLAKPVYDSRRRILLAAGRSIHPTYLQKIKELNIRSLIVEDAESAGITLDEMLDMPTWMDAIKLVEEVYTEVKRNKSISQITVKRIQEFVGKLLMEVRNRPIIVLIPSTALTPELIPYAHAVNVALLSVQVGTKLNYNMIQLRDLAIGALLHDIGKVIGNEENHPTEGFELLRKTRELKVLTTHVAFQHHESLDGSGYPRRIRGEEFLEVGQIGGIANLYENLISKEKYPPHLAMEMIMTKSENTYSHAVVQAFCNGVPTYPPGTKVKLNNGQVGIVYKIDQNLHRPTVRILSTMEEISLADQPTLMIQEVDQSIETV
ncbi:HD-GYP domain-containing protein [Cytobacillus sp. FJAT-54145]|uniref:HD-GYP domain-containing protein n=1 Tax=Cytobacillus spartinae TaxID=3299023 RepID=A0ABW6KBT4_9BACI